MADALRERGRRIRDAGTGAATQRPQERVYQASVPPEWCILRVVDLDTPIMWAQYVVYAFTSPNTTPVEDDTKVVAQFIRVYPPACVQFAVFSHLVRPLIAVSGPSIGEAITSNPDISGDLEIFNEAVAAESLRSNAYPLVVAPSQGFNTIFPPLFADRNTNFYDEQQQMSEGSGA